MLLDPTMLNFITNIAIITSAVAAASAAIFIAKQVAYMKQSRLVDTFLNVFNISNHEYMRQAANWVKYEMDSNLSYDAAISDGKAWGHISAVSHFFEMVGVLLLNQCISEDIIFDQTGPWIAGTWEKLQPTIDNHRKAKKTPDYCENFEMLVQRYYEWVESHPPKLEKRSRLGREHAHEYYKRSIK